LNDKRQAVATVFRRLGCRGRRFAGPLGSDAIEERHLRGIEFLSRPLSDEDGLPDDTFADFCASSSRRSAASDAAHVRQDGVFCDGGCFAMVTENTLYFRVDDQNATSRKPRPFRLSTTRRRDCTIDLSFWRVPERLFDEPDELVPGRERRWRRRGGLRRSENGRRQG